MPFVNLLSQISNVSLVLLLLIPLLTGLICGLVGRRRFMGIASVAGVTMTFLSGLFLVQRVLASGSASAFENLLYADGLSAYLVLIICLVGLVVTIYSVSYVNEELAKGAINSGRLRLYYVLLNLFLFTMLSAAVANNLGVLWVAVEATTLASALLVGFYDREESVEAAWKYLILGSVGITFALFGTILVYFSALAAFQGSEGTLNWTDLASPDVAGMLDPNILKLAFIFLLVGFGTKAGLAPMHTWLPDAHSQAPTPISALLSGVLINAAMYAILRYHHLLGASPVTADFSTNLLLIFGLLSVAIATPFILVQKDFKRLFAYSSIKHMGIMAVGISLGTPLAIYGALLHMLNHALAKAVVFLTAGNVLLRFHTKEIGKVTGLAKTLPLTAVLLLLGTLAISGLPPFGLFVSEFLIITSGFGASRYWVSILLLLFMAIAFAGFVIHLGKMVFGKAAAEVASGERAGARIVPIAFLLLLVLILGFYIPGPIHDLLQRAVAAVSYP